MAMSPSTRSMAKRESITRNRQIWKEVLRYESVIYEKELENAALHVTQVHWESKEVEMASITSGAIASVSRAMHNPSQACMVPHSTSPKSNSVFPVTRKLSNDLTLTSSSGNGGRVQSMLMQVLPWRIKSWYITPFWIFYTSYKLHYLEFVRYN